MAAIPGTNSDALWQLLGKRWFQIPDRAWNHPEVLKYRTSQVRFQTVHAGRRSFKTETGKRKVVTTAWQNERKRYFFGAPTREQAKRIFWRDIKDLNPVPFVKRYSESELWIELANGSELWVIGFDRPERFEGTPWHGGILSEFPHFSDTAWNENIAPALRDTGGWAIIEGVPEGRNHYFELCEYARLSGDPEWADYSWKTAEVRDPVEIEKEKARLDERTFRQEYEGSFETFEGRAFVYYDSATHRKPTPFDSLKPLRVSCDFNLDPCIWVLGQDHGGFIRVTGEIVQRRTDIWRMCGELKRVCEGLRVPSIVFYGDYQHGQTRSVSAISSSWQIIRDEFPSAIFRIKPNPRIMDGVNAVNAKLRNARGDVSVSIDPKAVELHKDLEQVSTQDILARTEGKDRGHSSSCLRYWMNFDYPVVQTPKWEVL